MNREPANNPARSGYVCRLAANRDGLRGAQKIPADYCKYSGTDSRINYLLRRNFLRIRQVSLATKNQSSTVTIRGVSMRGVTSKTTQYLSLSLLLCGLGYAQTISGSIAGSVVDMQNAAITNAVITAQEQEQKFTLATKTDQTVST